MAKTGKSEPAVLNCEQTRAVDQYAIEKLGIPGVVLMENAGRNAAYLIDGWLRRRGAPSGRVAVLCGRGNNGGDGFVIARHLFRTGHEVFVDLYGDPEKLSDDAAVNHGIARRMGIAIRNIREKGALSPAVRRWRGSDAIVDALLGTGFSGEVHEPLAGIIEKVNALDGPLIVAVDVPSGLSADTGEPGGVAVRANQTVTFVAKKAGYESRSARTYVGRIHVVDIGAPTELILEKLSQGGR
jgi:NAD(P)H-hydrate epimerase